LVAIETSGSDETYAWDQVAGADGFERVTLFETADAQRQPVREVAGRISAILDKIQPRAVVIPGWADASALAALQWCLKTATPAVLMSESTAWDERRSPWREMVKGQIVGLGSSALVGGAPHRDYMVQLGMRAECVFLGYDAVDNDYFREGSRSLKSESKNPPTGEAISRNLQIPGLQFPDTPFFLASARFVEKKNLPSLIHAYALYRAKAEKLKPMNGNPEKRNVETVPFDLCGPPSIIDSQSPAWDLVLLGDGDLRPSILKVRSSFGLDDHVHLPGFKQYPELPEYYARAGCFIHASTTEQWGLVVNEAMASGLPVLVSKRCGCAQDLVQDGINGFTFDPYNADELASLMLNMSESLQDRLSAFGAASQRIISEWGPERFASGLRSAAEAAIRVGPRKASILQRTILRALLAR
jgi:glycosyltransferase involved in cell wall biosynthesis